MDDSEYEDDFESTSPTNHNREIVYDRYNKAKATPHNTEGYEEKNDDDNEEEEEYANEFEEEGKIETKERDSGQDSNVQVPNKLMNLHNVCNLSHHSV